MMWRSLLSGIRRGACSGARKKHTVPLYPCTGQTFVKGFGLYLAENLEDPLIPPRNNLTMFARELEKLFGWPRISLVNSGSSANLAAALTLSEIVQTEKQGVSLANLGRSNPIGRVLTAGFTFPSTMTSLQTAGFELYLVDTESDGFCICPLALERSIESLKAAPQPPVAVCVPHFLGFPAQLRQIQALCKEHDLLLLQDACETMSLSIDGTPAHLFGDISA